MRAWSLPFQYRLIARQGIIIPGLAEGDKQFEE